MFQLVTAAAAVVVLIAAAVISVLIAASVVSCENENKDDEENPVTVASVTKEHSPDLLSHLPLYTMKENEKSDCENSDFGFRNSDKMPTEFLAALVSYSHYLQLYVISAMCRRRER